MATTDVREYANHELLEMDEQTARTTLPVAQYERWEKLTELHEQAADNREQFAEEAEEVAEITVSSDLSQLGTELDLYGNTLLVHIDSDDGQLQDTVEQLDALREKHADADSMDDVDAEGDKEQIRGLLQSALDRVILQWDGTDWRDLPDGTRADILADAAQNWGVDALLWGWTEIVTAVEEDQNDRLEAVESFRNPQRRGNR